MKFLVVPVVALLAAFAGLVRQETPAVQPVGPLRAFAPLVGKEWIATFPSGGLTDTQRFAWMYGGKFLRNTHEVRNPANDVVYGGETIYAWDEAEQGLRWWYFNSTGGYVVGTLEGEGTRYEIEGVNHAGDNQTARVRGAMEIGEGEWTSTSFFEQEGEWVERFTMTFRPLADETGSAR